MKEGKEHYTAKHEANVAAALSAASAIATTSQENTGEQQADDNMSSHSHSSAGSSKASGKYSKAGKSPAKQKPYCGFCFDVFTTAYAMKRHEGKCPANPNVEHPNTSCTPETRRRGRPTSVEKVMRLGTPSAGPTTQDKGSTSPKAPPLIVNLKGINQAKATKAAHLSALHLNVKKEPKSSDSDEEGDQEDEGEGGTAQELSDDTSDHDDAEHSKSKPNSEKCGTMNTRSNKSAEPERPRQSTKSSSIPPTKRSGSVTGRSGASTSKIAKVESKVRYIFYIIQNTL